MFVLLISFKRMESFYEVISEICWCVNCGGSGNDGKDVFNSKRKLFENIYVFFIKNEG